MSNASGLYAAVSAAAVQEKRMEMVTNNLANINTTGYKKDVLSFKSQLTEAEAARGVTALVGVSEVNIDFSQGSIQNTGNALDLAISGDGFFEVQTEDGIRYTRQGGFTLDGQSQLVTKNGDPVSGEGGPLILDGNQITIGENGEVTVDGQSAGRIKTVNFEDLQQLKKAGANLFENSGVEGNPAETIQTTLIQGSLEFSNVEQLKDMIQLIEISRSYESAQKAIQSIDEATKSLFSEVGKL